MAYPPPPEGPERQDVNVPLIVTIGAISALLLLVLVVGTQAWFRYEVQRMQQQRQEDRAITAGPDAAQQPDAPRWLDDSQQRAQIPIEAAMQIVLEQYQQQADEPRRTVPASPVTPGEQQPQESEQDGAQDGSEDGAQDNVQDTAGGPAAATEAPAGPRGL